nr:MAG TPA_asm: hypothetical protein [Caudoviricetes sp.]
MDEEELYRWQCAYNMLVEEEYEEMKKKEREANYG